MFSNMVSVFHFLKIKNIFHKLNFISKHVRKKIRDFLWVFAKDMFAQGLNWGDPFFPPQKKPSVSQVVSFGDNNLEPETYLGYQVHTIIITLTTTNIFPLKNIGWESIFLGFGLFQGLLLFVSGRVLPNQKKHPAPSNNLSKTPARFPPFFFLSVFIPTKTPTKRPTEDPVRGRPRLRLKLWQSAATLCLSSPDDDGVMKNSGPGPVHHVLWRRWLECWKNTLFSVWGGDDYGRIGCGIYM